ncbi:MAG: DUF1887 family CARF protein [Anaerolineales bacterium]
MAQTTQIVLAGEQTAPNLLPIRHYRPEQVFILHTSFERSKVMAERLRSRLKDTKVELHPIEAFDVGKIVEQMVSLFKEVPGAMVNITGGTKPMSIGALEAARRTQAQPFYIRSQDAKTQMDFYAFDHAGKPFIRESLFLDQTIEIDDYLVAYFGHDYRFTGFGVGAGEAFERTLYEILLSGVDEVKSGWKHNSNAVDVDFVIRCNNQIGIIEAKTGKKALTAEGIKQLAVAGGQRFFGTYVKRFLVIDRLWDKNSQNIRELAQAIGIIPIELPSYMKSGQIALKDKDKLWDEIYKTLGKPQSLITNF